MAWSAVAPRGEVARLCGMVAVAGGSGWLKDEGDPEGAWLAEHGLRPASPCLTLTSAFVAPGLVDRHDYEILTAAWRGALGSAA